MEKILCPRWKDRAPLVPTSPLEHGITPPNLPQNPLLANSCFAAWFIMENVRPSQKKSPWGQKDRRNFPIGRQSASKLVSRGPIFCALGGQGQKSAFSKSGVNRDLRASLAPEAHQRFQRHQYFWVYSRLRKSWSRHFFGGHVGRNSGTRRSEVRNFVWQKG